MPSDLPKNALTSRVITQAIAIGIFVVVPILITFMVPRTTIQLRRFNEKSSAEVTWHTLLVIPLYWTRVEPLLDAEGIVNGAKSIKEDRQRNRRAATQIADGSVQLIGPDQRIRVQSTYEQAPVQTQQIKAFIENPAAEPLMITANAPWMLTYVLGGVMTGFTILYCVGATIALARFLIMSILVVQD